MTDNEGGHQPQRKMFRDPKVAATVLVERAGKLLFVRRRNDPGRGLWCFPGGYVDYGEDPALAAIREVEEEAGLTLDQVALLDVGFDGRVIVITYVGRAADAAEPVPADDADMAAWFSPDELPPLAFASMDRPIALWREAKNQEPRT